MRVGDHRGEGLVATRDGPRVWPVLTATLIVVVPGAEAYLVLLVWTTCDIGGVNATVSGMTVALFVWPALVIAHLILLGGIHVAGALAARHDRRMRWLAVATQLVVVVVGAVLVATFVATPPEPSLICVDGVPIWWPDWLPHGSFGIASGA